MRPGSIPWLVAHDMRLNHRRFSDMLQNLSRGRRALILVFGAVAFHALAIPVAHWINGIATASDQHLHLSALMAAMLCFLLPWMVSQSLTTASRLFHMRGDLDLLLSSPVSSHAVLIARLLSLARDAAGSVSIFLVPITNMLAIMVAPHWLALYPVLVMGALAAAAIGLALSITLVLTVGPARARFLSQIAAMIIGSGFVITMQALALLPEASRTALFAAIENAPAGSLLHVDGPLWLPVRAMWGDVTAITQWTVACGALLALAAAFLGPAFMRCALQTAGAARTVRSRRDDRFDFGLSLGAALRRKEWRLLSRDPFLGSQLLLQIVYTLPVGIVLWRSQGNVALAVAPAIVVITTQIAGSLAWLAISGEDAPEFLQSAPVDRRTVDWHKLVAIGVPVGMLIALPLLGLMYVSPLDAMITLVFCVIAATCAALVNLWQPSPGSRRNMMRRHQQSKFVGMIEHLTALLWAVAAVLALLGSVFFIAPSLVAAGLLAIVKKWGALIAKPRKTGVPAPERSATAPAAA